jgi:hypothetical protein
MKKWTTNDVATLITYYGKVQNKIIAKMLGRSTDSITLKGEKLKLKSNRSLTRKKININLNFFSNPCENNSYWAGFIAADGCVHKSKNSISVILSEVDKTHLQKFVNNCGYGGEIKTNYKIRKCLGYICKTPTVGINICGVKQWKQELCNNFNITPAKTWTLLPPKQLNHKNQLCYIVGYIDGDGCIYKDTVKPNGYYYERLGLSILGTKPMLDWIKNIFDKISPMKIASKPIKRKNGIYQYRIVGKRAWKISQKLNNLSIPKLERKWSKLDLFKTKKGYV